MRRSAGFTLIELATTMSVVAILAGIAAPSFAGFIERQRASAAITSLMTCGSPPTDCSPTSTTTP